MAQHQLPCNGDGTCMQCKTTPFPEEVITCSTCATPWHVACLSAPPETLASTLQWECPDCTGVFCGGDGGAPSEEDGGIVAAIRAIEADESLTERQKAKRRQQLLSGGKDDDVVEEEVMVDELRDIMDESFKCCFCVQLLERPVTAPCGHNFCLKCFKKWIGQGKRTCATCRGSVPEQMLRQPRINSVLVAAIRGFKMSKLAGNNEGPSRVNPYVHDKNRPDAPYTSERAKRNGMANASSGRIFVNTPSDHFGPILAVNDPEKNRGVLVGDRWKLRMECRQWGMHYPPVAGIAGQSGYGAQSIVISGGYEDDEDPGEWLLYTGSGGRDLSGNKRTNKTQSFDQSFKESNEALRLSCEKGYPVRVLRSFKDKRSSYAPEEGIQYDGIYRIEKCWRKVGQQGFKVCRYLFVRCDNEPAPWTSDDHGDRLRPPPEVSELSEATDLFERTTSPSWDFDEEDNYWKWKIPPPPSRSISNKSQIFGGDKEARRINRVAENTSVKEKLLKEFSCFLCKNIMKLPVTTPCGHNFCKSCLERKFDGQTFIKDRSQGGRSLRTKKNVIKCPACSHDIAQFLQNPQVNREMKDVIEKLSGKTKDESDKDESNEEAHVSKEDVEADMEEEGNEISIAQDEENLEQVHKQIRADSESLAEKNSQSKKRKTSTVFNEESNEPAGIKRRRGRPKKVKIEEVNNSNKAVNEGTEISPFSPFQLIIPSEIIRID